MPNTICHNINQSPFSSKIWDDCLASIAKDDCLILINDGVYAVLEQHLYYEKLATINCYAIKDDVLQRGLHQQKCNRNIDLISYEEWVVLTVKHPLNRSWYWTLNDHTKIPLVDNEGFLKNLDDWSELTAEMLAANDGISLTEAHWEILFLIREFYQTFDLSPAMRPLIKHIGEQLDKNKANSIYLMQLFIVSKKVKEKQESPARVIARIAGLPKPKNCF